MQHPNGVEVPYFSSLNERLRIARQPVGYLINFGHKGKLEWKRKRFILSDLTNKPMGAEH